MALNATLLTTEIIDKLSAERVLNGQVALTTQQRDDLGVLAASIAQAVIEHIVTNGVVTLPLNSITTVVSGGTAGANTLLPAIGGIT
jgi:hypothetical protein